MSNVKQLKAVYKKLIDVVIFASKKLNRFDSAALDATTIGYIVTINCFNDDFFSSQINIKLQYRAA